jgi:sugar phosphate isomerase/epimerase
MVKSGMRNNQPRLNQSFKKRFPFRLSVPSFVYPADYAANVRLLGPFVDEIELLFFESDERSLPSEEQIQELAALASQHALSYNIHLPLDLDLGSESTPRRHYAVDRLTRFIQQTAPLSPTTRTLHLLCSDKDPNGLDAWRARTTDSLKTLIGKTALPPRAISVETLNYSPAWMAPIIEQLDLGVCMDVGHVLRYGFDLQAVLGLYSDRIDIIHLHGVAGNKDHLGLDQLPPSAQKVMQAHLSNFSGTLSLEIFAFTPLQSSLLFLSNLLIAARGQE